MLRKTMPTRSDLVAAQSRRHGGFRAVGELDQRTSRRQQVQHLLDKRNPHSHRKIQQRQAGNGAVELFRPRRAKRSRQLESIALDHMRQRVLRLQPRGELVRIFKRPEPFMRQTCVEDCLGDRPGARPDFQHRQARGQINDARHPPRHRGAGRPDGADGFRLAHPCLEEADAIAEPGDFAAGWDMGHEILQSESRCVGVRRKPGGEARHAKTIRSGPQKNPSCARKTRSTADCSPWRRFSQTLPTARAAVC